MGQIGKYQARKSARPSRCWMRHQDERMCTTRKCCSVMRPMCFRRSRMGRIPSFQSLWEPVMKKPSPERKRRMKEPRRRRM
jgi:hypothetical protein